MDLMYMGWAKVAQDLAQCWLDISDFDTSFCGTELRVRVFVSLQSMKFGVYLTVPPACPLQYQ